MIFYYLAYAGMATMIAGFAGSVLMENIRNQRKKNSIYYHKALSRRGEVIDVAYEEVA